MWSIGIVVNCRVVLNRRWPDEKPSSSLGTNFYSPRNTASPVSNIATHESEISIQDHSRRDRKRHPARRWFGCRRYGPRSVGQISVADLPNDRPRAFLQQSRDGTARRSAKDFGRRSVGPGSDGLRGFRTGPLLHVLARRAHHYDARDD